MYAGTALTVTLSAVDFAKVRNKMSKQTAFRLSEELLRDLDKVVAALNKRKPFPKKTRAYVVRMAIETIVDTARKEGYIK